MPLQRLQKVQFGEQAEHDMWKYVHKNCKYWLTRTENFRENVLAEYARLYKGTPAQESKNTPWPNAANNVIQLIATQCDELLSRVMAIYMIDPLWPVQLLGDITTAPGAPTGAEQKSAFETFLANMAMDPNELDMYRTEQTWWSSTIRNGTGIINIPYQYTVEKQLVQMDGVDSTSSATKPLFKDFIKYDGPRPENVPLNKFVNNLNYSKLDDSPFKFEIMTMSEHQLRERAELGTWSWEDVEIIISQPDRPGRANLQQEIEESQGLDLGHQDSVGNEYDILAVWFTYWHNGQKFNLVAHLHLLSQINLHCFYNYYPKNICTYEDAKLAYDDEQYLGYGLAEMLQGYQDEVSTTHNQRTDAGTLNNTTAFRVDKNSKLHSILTFYPGVMVPADAGEIERLDTGNPYAQDTNSETLTVGYSRERSGVAAAQGGAGGGIVNSKRGIYSAQGTFAAMQMQNNRTSLRTSDMRSAHTRAGDKLTQIYAHFGIGGKLREFGKNSDALKAALDNIKSGKMGLIIRPASASINKELEKQNDMLLSSVLERMYAGDAQIIQAMSQQGMPPQLQQYYLGVLQAKSAFMKHMLRNFNYDDIDRLIPPTGLQENRQDGQPTARSFPGAAQGQIANQATVPIGTGQEANQVPTGGSAE